MIIGRDSKIFSNDTGLGSHAIEHRGEKPYKSSHCDKTFSIKSHIINILIHILMINLISVISQQGNHSKMILS